jgi:hypothetical protein
MRDLYRDQSQRLNRLERRDAQHQKRMEQLTETNPRETGREVGNALNRTSGNAARRRSTRF